MAGVGEGDIQITAGKIEKSKEYKEFLTVFENYNEFARKTSSALKKRLNREIGGEKDHTIAEVIKQENGTLTLSVIREVENLGGLPGAINRATVYFIDGINFAEGASGNEKPFSSANGKLVVRVVNPMCPVVGQTPSSIYNGAKDVREIVKDAWRETVIPILRSNYTGKDGRLSQVLLGAGA